MLPPMAVSRAVFCCENYVIILIEFYLLFFLLSVKNPSASWALARAAVVTSWLWNHDAIAHVSFRLEQQDQVHRYVSVSLLVQPACFALNFISKQTCWCQNVGLMLCLFLHRHLKSTKPTFQLEDRPLPGVINPNVGSTPLPLENASYEVLIETPEVPGESQKWVLCSWKTMNISRVKVP